MLELLQRSPLLVLFLVAGGGFLLGKVTVLRFSLGVSAVLFCGLLLGALAPGVDGCPTIEAYADGEITVTFY